MVLSSCCQAFGTDFRTVIETWESGELSEDLILGGTLYHATSGRCLVDAMSDLRGAPAIPEEAQYQLGAGRTRRITRSSNVNQLMNQAGLKQPSVDTIRDLLEAGMPLGTPEELHG